MEKSARNGQNHTGCAAINSTLRALIPGVSPLRNKGFSPCCQWFFANISYVAAPVCLHGCYALNQNETIKAQRIPILYYMYMWYLTKR